MDWERLLRREMTPPFNPRVRSETDMKFVPPVFNRLEVRRCTMIHEE